MSDLSSRLFDEGGEPLYDDAGRVYLTVEGTFAESAVDRWWPEGYTDPAFVVQRSIYSAVQGGDYVRGSAVITLPATALRTRTAVTGFDEVANKALLITRATDYTSAEIFWGWPEGIKDRWTEVALVRSGFGTPITVNDGQTVFRAFKGVFVSSDPDDDDLLDGPSIIDQPLQPGQWYYYSLFFKTTPFDWVLGMSSDVLIPKDYGHADHLWDTIPPFYQLTDSNIRQGNGFLRQFLKIFGFELDRTREYVEQWQQVYHVDKSPMALLRHVGANFGLAYQQGIGDIRRRALIAGLPLMLQMRGTPTALKSVINAAKYDCDITLGSNLMLLPDDSDFFEGTGSWVSLHPVTDALTALSTIPPFATLTVEGGGLLHTEDGLSVLSVEGSPLSSVSVTANAVLPPSGQGRGTMRVRPTLKADELLGIAVACGDGITSSGVVGTTDWVAGDGVTTPPFYPVGSLVTYTGYGPQGIQSYWFRVKGEEFWGPGFTGVPQGWNIPPNVGFYWDLVGLVSATETFVPREIVPLYAGVPVEVGGSYGFSMQIKEPYPTSTTCSLMWFGEGGQPSNYLGKSDGTPGVPTASVWTSFLVSGTAPAGATYLVPVISIAGQAGPSADPLGAYVDIAGAQVYLLGLAGSASAAAPDSFLTLGDPSEFIGDSSGIGAPGGFIEYVLGDSL